MREGVETRGSAALLGSLFRAIVCGVPMPWTFCD